MVYLVGTEFEAHDVNFLRETDWFDKRNINDYNRNIESMFHKLPMVHQNLNLLISIINVFLIDNEKCHEECLEMYSEDYLWFDIK